VLRPYETASEKKLRGRRDARSKRSAVARSVCPVRIEELESRQYMSASLSSSGVLDVTGTSGPDTILLKLANGGSEVKVMVNGDAQKFTASDVTQVDVTGGGGKDYIAIKQATGAFTIPAVLNGTAGGDTLIGASGADTLAAGSGKESLEAGSGANVLDGGPGKDTLVGGSGDDVLQSGDGGKTVIVGGAGSDTIIGSSIDSITTDSSQNLISTDDGSSFTLQGLGSVSLPSNVADSPITMSFALTQTGSETASPASIVPNLVGPEQIRSYYNFPSLGSATSTDLGQGQTIAIIIPGDDPDALSDLTTFSEEYNLPIPTAQSFQKVYASGVEPPYNGDAALETSLDIEYTHAIAPDANIVLVEADYENVIVAPPNQPPLRALDFEFSAKQFAQALETAATILGDSPGRGGVVSMSFGLPEAATVLNTTPAVLDSVLQDAPFEYTIDSIFAQYPDVSWVAASGDAPGELSYPAMSPYVTGVGGTEVTLTSSGSAAVPEAVWPESGGGISLVEPEPEYQSFALGATPAIPLDVIPPATADSARVGPDVAFLSQPTLQGGAEGISIYDSNQYDGESGWIGSGLAGTSLATPMFAATVALGNQVRAADGEAPIGENLNPAIYYMGAEFQGRDFAAVNAAAAGGFDPGLQTGWGEPIVSAFINDLATLSPPAFTPPPQDVDVNNVQLKMTATEYLGINDPTSANFLQPDIFPGTTSTLVEIPGQLNEVPIYESGDFGMATSVGPGIIDLSLPAYDSGGDPLFDQGTGVAPANPLNPGNQFDLGDFNINLATGEFSGVTSIELFDSGTDAYIGESPTAATIVNGTEVEPYGMGLYVEGTVSNNGADVSGDFYTVIFNANGTYTKLNPAGASDILPDLEGSFTS